MRCGACFRRLLAGATCPAHPGQTLSTAPPGVTEEPAPPAVAGYELGGLLGGGGFARVYRARRVAGGAEVALKVALRPGDARFAREAEALGRLRPNVAPALLEAGRTADGRPFQALERVAGSLLADWLARRSAAAPAGDAVPVLQALGAAVDAFHAAGVVHRDLKPENVFLRDGGGVTVIDFGLARLAGDSDRLAATVALTATGQHAGTAVYMAPEQWIAPLDADARTDLYALGVVAFELLTGRPPFAGGAAEIALAHVSRRPPRASTLATLPAALDEVLARALAKDRAQRFQRAADLTQAIATALRTAPAAATPPELRAEPAAGRHEVALLAAPSRVPFYQVAEAVAPDKGLVAGVAGDRCVAAYPSQPADAGVRAACRAAARLPAAGGSVVHVAELRVREGASGVTVQGAALERAGAWAAGGAPEAGPGALLTAEAAARLGPGETTAAGDGRFVLTAAAPLPPPPVPELVEREALLAALLEEARGCLRDRRPATTTILGEAGLGKSALVGTLLGAARASGFTAVPLAAGEADAGPDALLATLLRACLGLAPTGAAAEIRAACARLLGELGGELWPAAAAALSALGPDEPALAPFRAAPGALRLATARVAGEALRRAAAAAPMAVLIDDAHRADPVLLDALELAGMAGGRPSAPLWIVAAARPELDQTRPTWDARADHPTRHPLRPLGEAGARALLAELLRPLEYLPDPVVARLLEVTGGVPLHLVEVARALRAGGALRRDTGTGSWFLAADDLLHAAPVQLAERLAARALAALPPSLRALAELCAVVGDRVSTEALEGAARRLAPDDAAAAVDPAAGLQRLARAGVLQRAAGGALAFRHPLLREGLESLLPPARRRELHAAALADVAERGGPRARLARHAAASGARATAARAHLELADEAAARHRELEAEAHFGAVLALVDAGAAAERQRALAGRGKARGRLRRLADARADLREARALAEARGDRAALAELLLEESTVLDWSFDFPASAALAAEAASVVAALGDPRLEARARFAEGRTHWRAERLPEAIAALHAAAERARTLGDYETRVLSLLLLAPALDWAGRHEEADARFDEVMALCEGAGDRLHLAVAHTNRMTPWAQRHRPERVLADARRCMELARECGSADVERVASYNLAELLLAQGDLDGALAAATRSRDLQLRYYPRPGPEDTLLLAQVHLARGEPARARALLDWIDRECAEGAITPSQRALAAELARAC